MTKQNVSETPPKKSRFSTLFRRKQSIENIQQPAPAEVLPVSKHPNHVAEHQTAKQPSRSCSATSKIEEGNTHGDVSVRHVFRDNHETPAQAGQQQTVIPERLAIETSKPNSRNAASAPSSPNSDITPRDSPINSPLPLKVSIPKSPTIENAPTVSSISSPNLSDRNLISASPSTYEGAIQFKPLEGNFIRLVRILPKEDTLIKCQIIHASLEQPIPYISISYARGDTGDKRDIEVDGVTILITTSLHGALQALQKKDSPVLVWTDVLCIDQANKNERSQQIQLMPPICYNALYVAIWLGPDENDSAKAVDFLKGITSFPTDSGTLMSRTLRASGANGDLLAVASLFEREYWKRLWIVQEIFNAKKVEVYCGSTSLPWKVYKDASILFSRRRGELVTIPGQFNSSQSLIYQGPASLPDLNSQMPEGGEALLKVLRACRGKIASDPRDKLYGILGLLPVSIRHEFYADYTLSVRDIYTRIVEFLLKATEKLYIIREAVHFPVHTRSINLPSFIPNWSDIPKISAMKYRFSASKSTTALYRFCNARSNKLEISGIQIDIVRTKGLAVGTLCNLGDYLMAFMQWRALLLKAVEGRAEQQVQWAEECFAETICLGQVPTEYDDKTIWQKTSYHVFANLFRDRLPYLPLDARLCDHLDIATFVRPDMRRYFLQTHFGDRMMGRSFCITQNQRLGMGSGLMLAGDIIIVPLGCSTPILLRPEGTQGEYRYVGDIYVDGFMHGKAIDLWQAGKRTLEKYILH